MLEGLEVSEISFNADLIEDRLDAEYYSKANLAIEDKLHHVRSERLDAIGKLTCSAFYPAATDLYASGDVPFARCVDAIQHSVISALQADSFQRIPSDFISQNNIRVTHPGDIVVTKVGTPCYASVVSDFDTVALSRTVLALTDIKEVDPYYLTAFLRSSYGFSQLMRERELTIQYQLTLERTGRVLAYIPSKTTQKAIARVLKQYHDKLVESSDLYAQAEDLLLSELGLEDWQPEEPLTYEATSKDAFAAGRLDAEYFKPKYTSLLETLKDAESPLRKLKDLVAPIRNGFDCREFVDSGTPYVRVGDVSLGRVDRDACNRVPLHPDDVPKDVSIQAGDVLFTRKGSFGNCAVVTPDSEMAIISSEIMRLRLRSEGILPEYLALYLDSLAGKLQVQQRVHGVAFYSISQPDLAEVLVCELPARMQERLVDGVRQSHLARDESKALLEKAKRAVEIAIEHGEEAAGQYLDGKAFVQSSALPAMTDQHKYFSVDALKHYLKTQKLTYESETVNTYMSRMKREGEIFSAGRGWYSSIATEYHLEVEPVSKLVAEIEKEFPLLNFSCWSTRQVNRYMHHLLAKYVTFVHVDRDLMQSVYTFLKDAGFEAYLNPTRDEAAKFFSVSGDEKTVVVRPTVTMAPVDGHFAKIEKILVDLSVEQRSLQLMGAGEFREMVERTISSERISISELLRYAKRRKVKIEDLLDDPRSIVAMGSS